ncbi:hypothetical protein ABIB95_005310 [Bradyrhizobium sp. LA2.1]
MEILFGGIIVYFIIVALFWRQSIMKRLWCWLRSHPYPWVYVCEPEDWILNSSPPSKCSNCGCTSR